MCVCVHICHRGWNVSQVYITRVAGSVVVVVVDCRSSVKHEPFFHFFRWRWFTLLSHSSLSAPVTTPTAIAGTAETASRLSAHLLPPYHQHVSCICHSSQTVNITKMAHPPPLSLVACGWRVLWQWFDKNCYTSRMFRVFPESESLFSFTFFVQFLLEVGLRNCLQIIYNLYINVFIAFRVLKRGDRQEQRD